MGMTDRQFDEYQKSLLRELEKIQGALSAKGIKEPDLDRMIQDINEGLKRL